MILLAALLLVVAAPVAAQTPTPVPTPTPSVIQGSDGDFVIVPQVTYGEGGVIVALLLVAGLMLVRISMEVAEWIRQ
jgi:hypothetical protein